MRVKKRVELLECQLRGGWFFPGGWDEDKYYKGIIRHFVERIKELEWRIRKLEEDNTIDKEAPTFKDIREQYEDFDNPS